MRLSQLLHVMDKEHEISVDGFDAPVDKMQLFEGHVRDIKRDDPINKMHVVGVRAVNDVICVAVEEPKGKEKSNG